MGKKSKETQKKKQRQLKQGTAKNQTPWRTHFTIFFFVTLSTLGLLFVDYITLPLDEEAIKTAIKILISLICGSLALTFSILQDNKLFGIGAWYIFFATSSLSAFSLYLWYALLWLPYEQKRPEVFSGLMSALAFVGLIITILVQVYHHRKSQEMELKKMRGEYISKHKRHTEIREEVLKKVREASNQGKYIEEIFSNRGELKSRRLSVSFEDELGLRNSPQVRSERKFNKSQDI